MDKSLNMLTMWKVSADFNRTVELVSKMPDAIVCDEYTPSMPQQEFHWV